MAKDPAFLFYPGDYLKDTQCLSERVQVAYDRIMCEHMRNICISHQQLKFFTKKLSSDEIEELMMVLKKVEGGYQIEWVAESICKRMTYSESRRKNRSGKVKNISSTYDKHMVNENEIVNEDEIKNEKSENDEFLVPSLCQIWYTTFPNYTKDQKKDFPAAAEILSFMCKQHDITDLNANRDEIKATFEKVAQEVQKDNFWQNKPLKSIASNIQEFYNKIKNPTNGITTPKKRLNRSEQLQAGYNATLEYYARRAGNNESVSGETD